MAGRRGAVGESHVCQSLVVGHQFSVPVSSGCVWLGYSGL